MRWARDHACRAALVLDRRVRFVGLIAVFVLAACGMAAPPRTEAVPVRGAPGYAAFASYGTNPVIDTTEEALVRVGVSGDRASWMLVRHYLDRGRLPPPEAVRVEDCVAALAPGVDTGAAPRLTTSIAPSPFRAGWHTLVVTVAAPRARTAAPPLVVTRTPQGALEQALVARGARIFGGDATALPDALRSAERLVLVSDGAGLGGPSAQAHLLTAIAEDHAAGAIVSVAGTIGPGLDDALLDRIAEAGGGLYELIVPGEETHLAERLARAPGLEDVVAEVRFDAARVQRWRLVGHESRTVREQRGLRPSGGIVPAGEGVDLVFEVKLASATTAGAQLGRARISAQDVAMDVPIVWDPKQSDRHGAVVVIAALAEKLRGSFWAKELAWDTLAAEVATLRSPALRDELGGAIAKARALWTADARIERPIEVLRSVP